MRLSDCIAVATFLVVVSETQAAERPTWPDPVFQALARDALAHNTELAAGDKRVQAERERVPQAASRSDPMVSLGYQNDGFTSLPYGTMGTTYFSIMATQAFPFPGKRRAREAQANAGVALAEAQLDRPQRTLHADLERAYIGLLWAQAQLVLLKAQEQVWVQAEATARARYEVSQGAQADIARAMLERTKLGQVRATLRWSEAARRLELNRLAVRPLEAGVEPEVVLMDLPLPVPATDIAAELEAASPELAVARAALHVVDRRTQLARLEQRPDFAVTAGVMPRGAMEPMWLVQFSTTVPLYAGSRQDRAVRESELNLEGGQFDLQGLQQQVRWRIQERLEQLSSLTSILLVYRETLLPQSRSAADAVLRQYAVGRAPFTAVLESMNARLADESSYLATLASAHASWIALYELDPGPTRSLGDSSAMSGSPVPRAADRASGASRAM